MTALTRLRASLDGELLGPGSPGYEAVRRPVHARFADVRPQLVAMCRSVTDVVQLGAHARSTGMPVVVRGGGHCFAGRSSTEGMVLDLRELDTVSMAEDGTATIGAGARLGQVYTALHHHGRSLPAGCGRTVGIAGLTLGGGIGLLGRVHGLTCDRLVEARAVLADGSVIDADQHHHPDLFWALRGAGGGQFAIVTSLVFDTVEEPIATRLEAHWSGTAVQRLASGWQVWAPEAPEELTANLTITADPGRPVQAALWGGSLLDERATEELLREIATLAGPADALDIRGGLPYHALKGTFDDLDAPPEPGQAPRIRSELFARPMPAETTRALLDELAVAPQGGRRRLTFTALGGAYRRLPPAATAFAHRDHCFLLEHVASERDQWVGRSWTIAHADGSGHVYPNFPDPELDDPLTAYHGANRSRLAAVKRAYDPHRFFDFPQCI